MAILLLTYDLISPGQKYEAIRKYVEANFTWCKGLESVYLLDTNVEPASVRDGLKTVVDDNDKVFVARLHQSWASYNYYCADWLNKPERNW